MKQSRLQKSAFKCTAKKFHRIGSIGPVLSNFSVRNKSILPYLSVADEAVAYPSGALMLHYKIRSLALPTNKLWYGINYGHEKYKLHELPSGGGSKVHLILF
jgi:hypothetical protein